MEQEVRSLSDREVSSSPTATTIALAAVPRVVFATLENGFFRRQMDRPDPVSSHSQDALIEFIIRLSVLILRDFVTLYG